MKEYLKLIRVKHWLKNILVFLPIFFNISFLNKSYLLFCFLAFIIFCSASSIVYILNDIEDLEVDKKHQLKKTRPLAAGKITIRNAIITMIVLLVIMLGVMSYLYKNTNNVFIFIIPLIYIVLNALYSKWLKNIPIIDIAILVAGFILRVIYGGVVVEVIVSKYLFLMVMFVSIFLGFGKRRNEIIKNGSKSRKVLKFYNKDFLDKNMYVSFALAIVSYTLWCVDPVTIAHVGKDYLFWTIPIVMIILQLYSLNIEGNSHGDPVEVILSDKVLLATGVLYGVVMILLLYVL